MNPYELYKSTDESLSQIVNRWAIWKACRTDLQCGCIGSMHVEFETRCPINQDKKLGTIQ